MAAPFPHRIAPRPEPGGRRFNPYFVHHISRASAPIGTFVPGRGGKPARPGGTGGPATSPRYCLRPGFLRGSAAPPLLG